MSLGCHITKNSNLMEKKYKTAIEAVKYETDMLNMSAISIFTVGPMNTKKVSMDHVGINKYCKDNDIKVYTHSSYIASGIWNVNKENKHEQKSMMYFNLLKDELVQGKQLGAKGAVVHYPRHPISTIVETLEIFSAAPMIASIIKNGGLPKVTLEPPASKPHDLLTYETPEKLNKLVHGLKSSTKIKLEYDLCIDTCHQYAGGVSYSAPGSWNGFISELSADAKNMIGLIHLNGASAKNFGTGKDGHIIPMSKDDAIWGHLISDEFRDYLDRTSYDEIIAIDLYSKLSKDEIKKIKNSGLYDIVQFAKATDISLIMEINRGDHKEVLAAMDIINGLLSD